MSFALAFSPFGPALHIPDGFLNLATALLFWAITSVFVVIAARNVQRDSSQILGERQIPLMGIMAAFIFAAQMINFPVAGGTSGHLLGGALAAIVLGPWAAILVMTAVIGVQGLLFQDGGLLAMGANIFNMGILTTLIGYGLYRSMAGKSRRAKLLTASVTAWLSVIAAALATSLQLWLSQTSALNIVLPAMLGVHALIGIGEALITMAALAFILQTRPDLLGEAVVKAKAGRGWVIGGALVVLTVLFLAPFASANPDGLERVAADFGFLDRSARSANAPFQLIPNYTLTFLGPTPSATLRASSISTILAGAIGVLVVAVIAILLARVLRRARTNSTL